MFIKQYMVPCNRTLQGRNNPVFNEDSRAANLNVDHIGAIGMLTATLYPG
jgi:hypothetical protein